MGLGIRLLENNAVGIGIKLVGNTSVIVLEITLFWHILEVGLWLKK